MRCRASLAEYVRRLGFLGEARFRCDDRAGAARAGCQALRLAQAYSVEEEGIALQQLASVARALGSPSARVLAVLAEQRLTPDSANAVALHREFGPLIVQTDDATRQWIERDYRADRGARLLREAFGVDVAEIDILNERLGRDVTEGELRGFLHEVREYCTRSASDVDATPQ